MLMPPPSLQAAAPVDPARVRHQTEDFEQAFAFLRAGFAWPQRVDWDRLRAFHQPRISLAPDDRAFHRALEDFLDAFADAHRHLGSNLADSWRLAPGDIAAEWREGRAVVVAVKPGSRAEAAGVRAGQVILRCGEAAAADAFPRRQSPGGLAEDAEARHWNLNAALAGRRGQDQRLEVQDGDGSRRVVVVPDGADRDPDLVPVRLLAGDVGYIAFRDLGSKTEVRRLDEALARFPQAKAWVLDVRINYGGDTAVMKPVLGRFLSKKMKYASMRKRVGEDLGAAWEEWVGPRGQAFAGPLAVLVSPWTMSVAEGLAMAVQGTGRGVAVGTRMAGLGAAVQSLVLKHSGLRVQASTEPVYDVHGAPRSAFRPAVPVDLGAPERRVQEDPILSAALEWIRHTSNEGKTP